MRSLVREQLAEGRSSDEVKAYFVSKYGEWISLSPSAGE
jgi:cytochrome c-type biogenesis protein CcmH/NrfF